MFGGGGMNPRKMEQMMEQMGIDLDELDVAEVVITLEDGTQLVFDDAEVTKMDARGQETYQVVGEPAERESATGAASTAETESTEESQPEASEGGIPEDDVKLVAQRTGASASEARDALEEADGDLAAAIDALE